MHASNCGDFTQTLTADTTLYYWTAILPRRSAGCSWMEKYFDWRVAQREEKSPVEDQAEPVAIAA